MNKHHPIPPQPKPLPGAITSHPSPATAWAGLAVLAAGADTSAPFAVMAMDLAADDGGWQHLLPAGQFKAVDGRPTDVPGGHWTLNEAIANRMIARAKSAANDIVVDYEHQTLNAEENGQPAPAAGWFSGAELQWRESGLWIRPRWTDRAANYIQNGEYKYLSAVFPYDKQTGEPLYLHSAALVNRAGVDGLKALAALNARHTQQPSQEQPMNKKLLAILAALGITIPEGQDATDEQLDTALAALKGIQAKSDKVGNLETEVAALKAKTPGDEIDLSQYVPVATYSALVTEMATLKAGTDQQTVEQLIADGRKEGKVLAAEEDYLTSFGKQQGVAALKEIISARPSLAALSADTQTTNKDKTKKDDEDLTTEDLAVLKATGLSREDYLASRKAIT